jgi:hypothetical protein
MLTTAVFCVRRLSVPEHWNRVFESPLGLNILIFSALSREDTGLKINIMDCPPSKESYWLREEDSGNPGSDRAAASSRTRRRMRRKTK